MGLFTPTGKDLFVKPEDLKSGTVDQFLQGLAKKESSGNYKALGPVINSGMYTGDRAYGKYQIMGKNVPEWSQKYLGKKLTADQLYQDEKLQDELMRKRAQELYSKYGNWEDVASVHFTGQPLKKAGNVKDQLGTTAPKYVQDVLAFMRGDSPAVKYQNPLTPGMAGSTPATQDQTVWNTAMQNIGQHPLIQGPLKALDFVGTTIDKGFGIPARLGGAIGSKMAGGSFSDQGIPETMSGQLEEATTGLTGSPTAGAVAGLLGSIAQPMPGPGKVKKIEKLAELINSTRKEFNSISDLQKAIPLRYHETSVKNLESIKRNGLTPMEGVGGKGVYFSDEISKGEASGTGLLIRAKAKDLNNYGYADGVVKSTYGDKTVYKVDNDYGFAEQTVPPNLLEYSTDGGKTWTSMTSNERKIPIVPGNLKNEFDIVEFLKGQGVAVKNVGATADTFVPGSLTTKILKKLEGRSTVSKQFIQDLAKSADVKQVEKNLILKALDGEGNTINVANFGKKVEDQLVPLNVKIVGGRDKGVTMSATWSGIRLKEEVRGNVAGYTEKVYQSPVPTSSGNVHFRDKAPNYFGHTRVEDMGDKKTRRVLEVQSDLYQKGDVLDKVRKSDNVQEIKSLEAVKNLYDYSVKQGTDPEKAFQLMKKAKPNSLVGINSSYEMEQRIKLLQKQAGPDMEKYNSSIEKIEQYSNPTAHFRMAREEIAQASKEGKTKVQFPTGETALKIEGLGGGNGGFTLIERVSQYSTHYNEITPEKLKVGQELSQGGGRELVVAKVLGDGKFEAYPKRISDNVKIVDQLKDEEALKKLINSNSQLYYEIKGAGGVDEWKKVQENWKETFDISTKVDTKNPIYKFYEDEMAKYLKNNYDAKLVKDKKGVTWYEVSIKPEMGTRPMDAFAMAGLPFAPVGYDQMTKAQENENNKETIQLNPFQPGFLTSSQTVNKIEPPIQPPAFTVDQKRGFQGNNSMNPDGLSRMGLNPLIPANKPKTQAPNTPMKVEIQQVGPTLMAMPKKKYSLDEVRQKINVKYHPGNNGFYNSLSPNKDVVENFKKHFPDPEIALMMRGISKAESGGKQDAHNKNTQAKGKYKNSLDVGFFQINDTNRRHKFDKRGNIIYTETPEAFRVRMLNLDENFKEAKRLLYEGGFERWATFNEGKHIPFLDQYLAKTGQ